MAQSIVISADVSSSDSKHLVWLNLGFPIAKYVLSSQIYDSLLGKSHNVFLLFLAVKGYSLVFILYGETSISCTADFRFSTYHTVDCANAHNPV